MQKITFRAFTLVELIVVITIVGILSTVGFVSYSGYLTGARDSNRISQLTKLSDSLQVYSASKTLPLPDDYIEITASGTIIAYQGYVGVDVLETIDYTNGGKDPKDDSYYTYYLTKDRKSLQLMAMMEEQSSTAFNLTNTTRAINYEDRYPKVYGRKLGVLTYSDESNIELLNTPAHEITGNAGGLDVVNTTITYTSHITDAPSDKISGTGASLSVVNPSSSCKRIKQTGGAGNSGTYTISPVGTAFEVYCDMETSGGGWTATTMLADTTTQNLFDTGNTGKIISITKDISSKGVISDIWRDDKDKDIMIKCEVNNKQAENYSFPFIIKGYLKVDIGNLERANKGATVFSSIPLVAEYKGKNIELFQTYGANSGSASMYIRDSFNSPCFAMLQQSLISSADTANQLCPQYNLSNSGVDISQTNYCVAYIK